VSRRARWIWSGVESIVMVLPLDGGGGCPLVELAVAGVQAALAVLLVRNVGSG
jgi:hypothetical protein